MKTEYRLAVALKDLMSEQPLDTISVTTIAKKAHIRRQTFYYHFHDIFDLLTLVFLDEKIPNITECKNYKELLESIFKYYKKNEKFIDATLSSAGKELFIEFLYNIFYTSTLRFSLNYEVEKNVTSIDSKNIARFYASAFSQTIAYYLLTRKEKTLSGLLNSFSFLGDDNLKNSLQNAAKKRSNHE